MYRRRFTDVFDLLDGTSPDGDIADAAIVAINNNNLDDVRAKGGGPRDIMWARHEGLWGQPDVQSPWCIVGEEQLQIYHKLLLGQGASKDKLHTVVSQLAALDQCRSNIDRLEELNPGLKVIEAEDTAESAALIKTKSLAGDLGFAAIASAEAGELYGLQVADEHFQDEEINITRFLILRRRTNGLIVPEGANVTTFLMDTGPGQKPGALRRALAPFEDNEINVSHLTSRLRKGSRFESRFWVDADAGYGEGRMKESIGRMREEHGCEIHILGSYVRHPYPDTEVA
jgi:prephenate dehydratase